MNTGWYGDNAEIHDVPEDGKGNWGYIENILFHCDAPGNVTINLWSSLNFIEFTLEDSLIINQVPELVTIAMLAFGALALRKRE